MKRTLYFLLVVLMFMQSLFAKEPDEQIKNDLIGELQKFAKEHSLTMTQLEETLGKIVLNERSISKGGVGVINEHTFIMLNERQNALVVYGEKWKGQSSTEQEIVLIDGQRVVHSIQDANASNLIIIIFSPKYARFIDLASSRGGEYERNPM
jgi:hypothetical protein